MLEQLVASRPRRKHTPFTLIVSTLVHSFLAGLLLLLPLFFPETLALQHLGAPPPPFSAPRRVSVKLVSEENRGRPAKGPSASALKIPVSIPKNIPEIDEPARPTGTEEYSDGLAVPIAHRGTGGLPEGFGDPQPRNFLPPEPPKPVAKTEVPVGPVRIGGSVQNANLIYQLKPDYPHLAKLTRVQGAVILEAVIDREGRVENLKVLSGHPLLIQAASSAVQQWRYRPTLLNGEPVEVITQITVNFSLGNF